MVFRADASKNMGVGHVMRSIALAEEAISQGISCIFIGDLDGLKWLINKVENIGFCEVYKHSNQFKPSKSHDILILDSYSIDESDNFLRRTNWKFVLCISDKKTPLYDCDLVLHSGLDLKWLSNCPYPYIGGADYVLMRNSIKKLNKKKSIKNEVTIIVSGGGTDPFGFSQEVAKILDSYDLDMSVHFFSETKIISKTKKAFFTHQFGNEFDQIAELADIALTTASTNSIEFIAREIPTGIVCVTDNQAANYNYFVENSLAAPLGTYSSFSGWQLNRNVFTKLIQSPLYLEKLQVAIHGLIDLKGPSRVIDFLRAQVDQGI